jgi:hypothetical protein
MCKPKDGGREAKKSAQFPLRLVFAEMEFMIILIIFWVCVDLREARGESSREIVPLHPSIIRRPPQAW